MRGFYSPYIPGWDCHGLPIELQVDKNLGDKKDKFDILEKRKLCREYADSLSISREMNSKGSGAWVTGRYLTLPCPIRMRQRS